VCFGVQAERLVQMSDLEHDLQVLTERSVELQQLLTQQKENLAAAGEDLTRAEQQLAAAKEQAEDYAAEWRHAQVRAKRAGSCCLNKDATNQLQLPVG